MTIASLSSDDHAKVSNSIAEAEAGTAGEILAVTAGASDSYHDVGLHYAVAAMFLFLGCVAAWPQLLDEAWTRLMGWTAPPSEREMLTLLLAIALTKFLVVLIAMKWMPLRLALTPGSTKARRVRRRAITLFKAAAERRTTGRTGILIYLSMAEHRAEIVADEAILRVTDDSTWGEAMAALLGEVRQGRIGDGLVAAIERVGAVLAEHFPRSEEDRNEIPDKLIEL